MLTGALSPSTSLTYEGDFVLSLQMQHPGPWLVLASLVPLDKGIWWWRHSLHTVVGLSVGVAWSRCWRRGTTTVTPTLATSSRCKTASWLTLTLE